MEQTTYDTSETPTYLAAKSEVQTRMNDLAAVADMYEQELKTFINETTGDTLSTSSAVSQKLADVLTSISSLKISLPSAPSPAEITTENTSLNKPEYNHATYDAVEGERPEAPQSLFDHIDVPNLSDIPEPVINIPEIPDMPNISDDLTKINRPNLQAPDAPEYKSIDNIETPEFNIPEFELDYIDFENIKVPDTNLFYSPREFELRFTTKIEELLSGKNGLSEETEEAIWARAKARNDLKNEKMYKDAEAYFASRGFEMPTGAFNATLQDIRKEINRSEEQINYEIAAESSRIAHEFTKVYADTLSRHEGLLADIHNNEEQRFYDAIKLSMQNAIDVFNSQIQHFKTKTEYQQLRLQEFESRLKTELSKLDLFRAKVEESKLTTEYNRGLTEQYLAGVEMSKAAVELYTAEVDSVKNEVAVNEQKISAYRARLEGIAKNVDAELSKVNIFNSLIDADKNKIDLYNSQVKAEETGNQAYNSYVSAMNSYNSLQIENSRARAYIEQKNAETEMSKLTSHAQISRYEADIDSIKAKDKLSERELQLQEYRSETDAEIAGFEKEASKASLTKDVALANLESSLRELTIRSDELKSKTQVTAQLIASSLNAINVSASVSSRASWSDTRSESKRWDETKEDPTTSHIHHYQES